MELHHNKQQIVNTSGFSAIVKARHGFFLYNKNDVYVGKSIEVYGEWSENEIELFSTFVGKGSVVIEIGSNIGSHTVPIAKMVGPTGYVFAFEPQQLVYYTLSANIVLNNLTNVEAVHAAVSSQAGVTRVPYVNYDVPNNFGGIRMSDDHGKVVRKISLDHMKASFKSLSFIKVDAEGMELEIVKGAKEVISAFRPIMYLESDDAGGTELVKYVNSLGYKVYKHTVHLFNRNNYNQVSKNIWGNVASFNILCVPAEHSYAPTSRFMLEYVYDAEQ